MNMPYASASLYVGDLNPDVNEDVLTNLFKEVGSVVSIRICRDHTTKKSLGYAYVNFSKPEEAEKAIDALNYTSLNGQQLRIMWSQRDPAIRKSGKGNIFVKNLDASIDNKALYDTFSSFGDILSCKVQQKPIKKVVTTEDGKTDEKIELVGYGFVHFERQESANQAVDKLNGMLLNGKKVFVGHFQRKEQRLNIKASEKEFTNIYVKNLDTSVANDEFLAIFSKFGPIQHGELMLNEDGTSRGFGFINYQNPGDAANAVDQMNNQDIKGKKVFVGRAQKKMERLSILRERREKIEQEKQQKYQGVNLYVKNLDDTIDEEKLRSEFSKYGKVQNAIIMTDRESGTKKGFGFVCYENPEDATRAIQDMHGKMFGTKPLYVALAEKKEVRQAKLRAQHAQQRNIGYLPHGFPVVYNAVPQMPRGFAVQPMVQQRFPTGPIRNQVPGRGYPVQPMSGQPRGGAAGRGRGGRTQPQHAQAGTGRGQANNRGVKYNQNVRNQPQQQQQQPQPVQQPVKAVQSQQQQVQTQAPSLAQEILGLEKFSTLSEEEQKAIIGEKLYPLIYARQPDLAGKITGMLLDLDNGELLSYLDDHQALDAKVQEAIAVLNESQTE